MSRTPISQDRVDTIRRLLSAGATIKHAAETVGVSRSFVFMVKKGKANVKGVRAPGVVPVTQEIVKKAPEAVKPAASPIMVIPPKTSAVGTKPTRAVMLTDERILQLANVVEDVLDRGKKILYLNDSEIETMKMLPYALRDIVKIRRGYWP